MGLFLMVLSIVFGLWLYRSRRRPGGVSGDRRPVESRRGGTI